MGRRDMARGKLNELGVVEEALAAAFAAEAALLVAAKGRRGVELVVSVGPDDAGLELDAHLEHAGALVGPDTGAEAVGRIVGLLDGLLDGAEGEDAQHGAEDLLACDAVAHAHAAEERGAEIETLGRQAAGRLEEFGTLLDAALDELGDL